MYGGGVYVYSSYENSYVSVKNCSFQRNKALSKRNDENLFGGSSAFFTVRNLDMQEYTFEKSFGVGGALKVCNVFDEDSPNTAKNLEEFSNSISISGCNFDNEKGSTNSIYLFSNRPGNNVDINDCKFIGKLSKESHYIDGKLINKDSNRIHIDSCKFEHEINESIKIDLVDNIVDSSINILKDSNYHIGKSIPFYILLLILSFGLFLPV